MKRVILTLAFLLLSANSFAASISTTTCPGAGCYTYNVGGQGSIGVQVTGTWVGTITFQGSLDNSTYTSLRVIAASDTSSAGVTTTTSNGIWNGTIAGLSSVRVVFTAYTSGTAVVSFRSTTAAAKFNGGGSGSGITGTVGNTQIIYGTGASSIASSSTLIYTPASGLITVEIAGSDPSVPGLKLANADGSVKLLGGAFNGDDAIVLYDTFDTGYIDIVGGAASSADNKLSFENWSRFEIKSDDIIFTGSVQEFSMKNANSIKSAAIAADTFSLSAFDVNAAAYVELLTLTANNAPSLVIAPSGDGTVSMQGTYKSNDGTAGLTQTCAAAVTAVTVKNGLITAITCP